MEFWIGLIKALSAIATGFFGVLALLTKYKDDNTGKITHWGKIALGGIIFSSLLSVVLLNLETSKESAKQQAEATKAASEARKAEESSKATLKNLQNILVTAQETLDGQIQNLSQAKIITEKMDDSLNTQNTVLAGNKDILNGVIEGAKRDSENTVGILRTIWEEGNRVEARQITIAITYTFMGEIVTPPPFLFENGETLSIRALPKTAPPITFPINRWSSTHLISDKYLSLKAREQKVTRKEYHSVDGITYEQTSYFSDFEGDIKSFYDIAQWNGAIIDILLTNQDPSLIEGLRKSLDGEDQQDSGQFDDQSFRQEYDIPKSLEEGDYRIMPLPVHARLIVYLRERPIAVSEATLAKVWERDEDVRNLIVAKFKIIKIPNDLFQSFKPTLTKLSNN